MRCTRATARNRWSVASRVLAAGIGGYGLVSMFGAALAVLLPMPRLDAFLTSAMSAFPIYAVVIMLVFRARSAGRAWLWLALASAPPGVVAVLLLPEAVG